MARRAPEIPETSMAHVVNSVLAKNASRCLDNEHERNEVARALLDALRSRPEAVAWRQAFLRAPSQIGKLVVMREIGGDAEGELLQAGARLAGDDE